MSANWNRILAIRREMATVRLRGGSEGSDRGSKRIGIPRVGTGPVRQAQGRLTPNYAALRIGARGNLGAVSFSPAEYDPRSACSRIGTTSNRAASIFRARSITGILRSAGRFM